MPVEYQGQPHEQYAISTSLQDLKRLKKKLNNMAEREKKSKDCRRILVAILNFETYGPALRMLVRLKIHLHIQPSTILAFLY